MPMLYRSAQVCCTGYNAYALCVSNLWPCLLKQSDWSNCSDAAVEPCFLIPRLTLWRWVLAKRYQVVWVENENLD